MSLGLLSNNLGFDTKITRWIQVVLDYAAIVPVDTRLLLKIDLVNNQDFLLVGCISSLVHTSAFVSASNISPLIAKIRGFSSYIK